jgi:hypothetical protein
MLPYDIDETHPNKIQAQLPETKNPTKEYTHPYPKAFSVHERLTLRRNRCGN